MLRKRTGNWKQLSTNEVMIERTTNLSRLLIMLVGARIITTPSARCLLFLCGGGESVWWGNQEILSVEIGTIKPLLIRNGGRSYGGTGRPPRVSSQVIKSANQIKSSRIFKITVVKYYENERTFPLLHLVSTM